ncbi:hypothetical protein DID96_13495 [Burkholderia sp. Bp8963]|nr:hypothetical protein DID96_13495 [Burkholderia sp. Bp8963]
MWHKYGRQDGFQQSRRDLRPGAGAATSSSVCTCDAPRLPAGWSCDCGELADSLAATRAADQVDVDM